MCQASQTDSITQAKNHGAYTEQIDLSGEFLSENDNNNDGLNQGMSLNKICICQPCCSHTSSLHTRGFSKNSQTATAKMIHMWQR
jgi:hypothetical protein